MRQIFKNSTRLTMASLLGLALTASVGWAGAQTSASQTSNGSQTQNRTRRDRRDTNRTTPRTDDRSRMSNRNMDDPSRMSSTSTDMNDEDMALPAPMSYPNASPGAIDLFHWSDYSRMHLREGSTTERMMDRRNNRPGTHEADNRNMEDEEDLIPMTPMYPRAAPGSLDLFYWTGYDREKMKTGSATEEKMDKMRMKDRTRMSGDAMREDEEDLTPMTPSYPRAAPGSLDLFYWTGYNREQMKTGSAMEERMEKMKQKDMKKNTK